MTTIALIEGKLRAALATTRLEVVDESHFHAGHAGASPSGGTHFRVIIRSPNFKNLSRIEISRKIHSILKNELQHSVHALSVDARAGQ